MEFKGLKKIHDGHFIHRYDITYETVDGKEKVYEMISRNPDISTPVSYTHLTLPTKLEV